MLELGRNALKIGSGATPRGGKSSYLKEGPYALVRSQNVHNHGFENEGLAYISEDQAKKLSNVELLENDVLINITGDSVARVCLLDPSVLPARVNQHVAILRPDPSVIDPHFLRYFLVKPSSQSLLLALASAGATRNALTKSMLESLEVPDLDIDLQRSIGCFLKSLDDKIELNRRMNETLEEMARALFRDWFVDFGPTRRQIEGATDPAAIMGHAFPAGDMPTELGNGSASGVSTNQNITAATLAPLFPATLGEGGLPEGWETRDLRSALTLNYGKSLTKKARRPGPFNVFGSGGISGTHDTSLAEGPSIIVGRKGTVGSLYWTREDFYAIDTVFYVTSDYPMIYCHRLLETLGLETMNTDAAVPGLNRDNAYRQEFAFGGDDLIDAYAEFVGTLIEKSDANQQENQTLAEMRDLLLPKLMSGEIRLKDAEAGL